MDTWPAATVPELPGHGPEPVIWDTASGAPAVAASGHRAALYACGITPYDATHMGHAATYVAWDLLVRAWRDAGHDVVYAQNVTDVDDPLLERADRDGEDWRELAVREIGRYRSDMAALRVLPPARLVGAVEALPLIEEFNQVLAGHSALYELDGDTYFARAADPEFGSVSHLGLADMTSLAAERGGDPQRPGKKDPLDPLVWLAARPGEPSWPSGFGPGRPGWHVECAAIATACLGTAFDVQAGGSDLVFPHHELSASHARVALGGQGEPAFARRYAHAGMVRLAGEKMSKSLGNLVFVSRLREAGVDPMAIRLAILAHHYRRDWDWTEDGLAAAGERLARWRAATDAAGAGSAGAGVAGDGIGGAGVAAGATGPAGIAAATEATEASGEAAEREAAEGQAVLAGVRERIADDLDAPGAVAVVDAWADRVLSDSGGAAVSGAAVAGAGLVRATVDALLGIAL